VEHHAGLSVVDLFRKHGISDATFYKWRARYGGMDVSDAKKLKALQDENANAIEIIRSGEIVNYRYEVETQRILETL